MLGVLVSALLILFDAPLHFGILDWFRKKKGVVEYTPLLVTGDVGEERVVKLTLDEQTGEVEPLEKSGGAIEKGARTQNGQNGKNGRPEERTPLIKGMGKDAVTPIVGEAKISIPRAPHVSYTPPPLSLLSDDKGKPGFGDIKANANTIKRTLQNYGVDVEMDEVTVGPSVTRYSLKPADGGFA